MINMKKKTNTYPATIEDLLAGMQDPSGRYMHLQVIFSRDQSSAGLGFGQRYLVVNRNGFGVYQLNGVDYNDGILQMLFTNPDTGKTAEISLDINDEHPAHFLINWNDLTKMVHTEQTHEDADDLLELDTE